MNPPLTEAGIALARSIRVPDVRVYSSDLQRAVQTAQCLRRSFTPTAMLRPWNVGVFAGQPAEIVHPRLVQYYQRASQAVPFGESFDAFCERYLRFIRSLREDAVLVTHFRNCKVLLAWVAGGCKHLDRATLERDDIVTGQVCTIGLP